MTLRELFSDPDRWTQHYLARDKNGDLVEVSSEEAVCFCLIGGINKCYPDFLQNVKVRLKLKENIRETLTDWNDDPKRTIQDVQELVKLAGV